jgi:hypothetical protein
MKAHKTLYQPQIFDSEAPLLSGAHVTLAGSRDEEAGIPYKIT